MQHKTGSNALAYIIKNTYSTHLFCYQWCCVCYDRQMASPRLHRGTVAQGGNLLFSAGPGWKKRKLLLLFEALIIQQWWIENNETSLNLNINFSETK